MTTWIRCVKRKQFDTVLGFSPSDMIVDDDLDVFRGVEDGARGIVAGSRRFRIYVQDLTISLVFEEETGSILRDHCRGSAV